MFEFAGKAIRRCLRLGAGRASRPLPTRSRPVLEMLESRLVPADPGVGVIIIGAPLPPIASDDGLSYNVDTSSPLNVFQNDVDPNPGGGLVLSSITVVTDPQFGRLTLDPTTGILLYTPNYLLPPGLPPGQQPPNPQQDSFTYTIRNTLGLTSNVATATVSPVAPVEVNDIVPGDDFAFTSTVRPVSIRVAANDEVRDGSAADLASITLYSAPKHGAVTINHVTGAVTYTPAFGFAGWDSFQYRISTTAGGGPNIGEVFVAVSPAPPRLQTDPLGGKMLVVDGTYNDDRIVLDRGRRPNDIVVWINGVQSGTFRPTSRVVVFGYSGNDTILVSKRVHATTWLYGGDGNDTLQAGGGRSVLLGGGGDDVLLSGPGRDLLIGGAGADRLVGAFSFDLLVSGATRFDASVSALNSVFLEWNSSRSFQQRILNLTAHANASFRSRSNGSFFLSFATVLSDGAANAVFGGSRTSFAFSFVSRVVVTSR